MRLAAGPITLSGHGPRERAGGLWPGGHVDPKGRAVRNTFLVCYDVCDDKRLRKVFKTMRDFGDHLQYSVFECYLNPTEKIQLEDALSKIIDHDEDQVLFVALGPSEGRGERVITALGLPYSKLDAPCYVV